jgi:hypothetical protein
VGTSTGAIVACGLAAGVHPAKLCQVYREYGSQIFPIKLPQNLASNWVRIPGELRKQVLDRPKYLVQGAKAFRKALKEQFGERTLGQIYKERGIALAIPAVEMSNHAAWVFKTPHLEGKTTHRDDHYSLVDVCMATSAAPIFRSLAAIKNPDTPGSPWQNGKCESFNGRFRDECLNMEVFDSLPEAQFVIERWREHYNSERPHSALAYLTPLQFIQEWENRQDELRQIA